MIVFDVLKGAKCKTEVENFHFRVTNTDDQILIR